MFTDLKMAIGEVLFDAATLDAPLSDDFVVVSREHIEALEAEYKLCFVEPEDDDEWQDFTSPLEEGETF